MNTLRKSLTALVLGLFSPLSWAADPHLQTSLSSAFLARGEEATLLVIVIGPNEIPDPPVIPQVAGLKIQGDTYRPEERTLPGRQRAYIFPFVLSTYDTGRHVIPPIEVKADGATLRSEPIEFEVFPADDLKWSNTLVGDRNLPYSAAIHIAKPSPYEGETMRAEIKLYFPASERVEDWGVPEVPRDGVASWRFEVRDQFGQAYLLGRKFRAVSYASAITPTRSGKVSIGPVTSRVMSVQVSPDSLGAYYAPANIEVGKFEINVKPLPAGAPAGFENAVGRFTIETSAPETETRDGDPLSVTLAVKGEGNLDTLHPPKPADTDGWKIYEATRQQAGGEESRQMSGIAVFRQFLRPLNHQTEVPPFRLVYFDPGLAEYRTATSDPIRLTVLPAPATSSAPQASVPQALPLPLEKMTDILGILPNAPLLVRSQSHIPSVFWHALPVSAALVLLLCAFRLKVMPKLRRKPETIQRAKEFDQLRAAPEDAVTFLRAAGRFIERWLGDRAQQPEISAILRERDQLCFQNKPASAKPIDATRRREILRALQRIALPVLMACMAALSAAPLRANEPTAPPPSASATAAYEQNQYADAIRLWLGAGPYELLSADTLYGIGNACYRLGSPGYAALYYRRALDRNPAHLEARQNLRFLERKSGSLTIQRPDYQYALARFGLPFWKGLIYAGVWLVVLSLLVFPATWPGSRFRIAAVCGFITAPVLMACGGLGWRYFPDDAEFAPRTKTAVVVADQTVAHTDASRTSPDVIDAPPGSLCEIIRQTGDWSYVSFATRTRGWVLTESIEPIIPAKPPQPPHIRKPKADGSSA